MKPAAFSYLRPSSLDEAIALLGEHGAEAKLLAGGQSLAPMMNMRLAQPRALVDLNSIAGLDFVKESADSIEIGALARHHAVASCPAVQAACPLLAAAAREIGHYAIRQRGTLGGSLAHADPAAQLPLVAATLQAEVRIASRRGERRLVADEFFVSIMTTALEPDEIIVSVRFPKAAPAEGHAYLQFSRRRGDFAIVAVAATLRCDAGRRIASLRLGVGGVADRPIVLSELAARAVGGRADEAWAAELARQARQSVEPLDNPRVPLEFRRELVEVLTRRALLKALATCR